MKHSRVLPSLSPPPSCQQLRAERPTTLQQRVTSTRSRPQGAGTFCMRRSRELPLAAAPASRFSVRLLGFHASYLVPHGHAGRLAPANTCPDPVGARLRRASRRLCLLTTLPDCAHLDDLQVTQSPLTTARGEGEMITLVFVELQPAVIDVALPLVGEHFD